MSEKMADGVVTGMTLIIGVICLVNRFFSDKSIVMAKIRCMAAVLVKHHMQYIKIHSLNLEIGE